MLRITKGLVLGVLATLVVGTLAATAINTAQGTVDDSPMTVPLGRQGDQVTYARFGPDYVESETSVSGSVSGPAGWSTTTSQTTTTVHEDGQPRLEGFTVADITTMSDRAGVVHDVVLVVSGTRDAGQEMQDDFEFKQYIDLATRDPIRNDYRFTDDGGDNDFQLMSAEFGPGNLSLGGFAHGEAFVYQGRTFRLGDDLTDVDVGKQRKELFETWGVEVVAYSITVDRRAIVDGLDAYGIRSYLELRVPAHAEVRAETGTAGETTTATESGRSITIEIEEMTWISAEVPYPLLIEQRGRARTDAGEEEFEESLVSLAAYEPGDRPIPWGEDRATEHYRERNVDAETAPGAFPADGTGSSLGYPMSQAIASAEGDMTLIQFQLWRQANPGNHLVGAQYGESTDSAGLLHRTWMLVFAVPSGDAYMVSSERVDGVPSERNQDGGTTTVAPFAAADLPRRPITWAAAERLWSQVAGETYEGMTPNHASWGTDSAQDSDPSFDRVEIGYSSSEGGLGQQSFETSRLTIEAGTGNLLRYSETAISFRYGLLAPTAPATASHDIRTKSVPSGIQPPEIEEAALVSTSLLALFLAVYFWPFVKYAGAQGLFLLPGYAKLRKDAILKNKVRGELLDAIRQDPGVHASELARRIDAGWGTLVYHLRVLEKNKYVTSLLDGRHKRFFPVGEIDWTKRGQVAALRHPRTRALFELIEEEPGIIQGALARRADLSVPSAIWHLKRLEEAGLVGREKRGRKVHYFTNESPPAREPYDPDEAVEVA